MNITKILSILFLICFSVFAQTTIAVVDFEGKGVSKQEASALTDRFRDELFKSGRFQVMERAYMEQILKEQGFQMSGCTSNECMVEVGQLVAVAQIVGGSVSKVGDIYSVSARIISIETGKILSVSNYDFKGNISALMTEGMRNVVAQLTTGKTTTQPKTESNSSIYVTSTPSSAAIYIDGTKINGTTPFMIDNLINGEHRLILQQGNYTADTTLNLEPYDVKKIHLTLKKGFGRLKVMTTPYEAKVFIDGVERGITPTLIRDIIAGMHQLKIVKEEYLPVEMPVEVSYNEVKEMQVILKKPAMLSLSSSPDSVEFALGEKYKGTTPDRLPVEDGKYRLRCTKANYYPYETDLTLKEAEVREINITLKHQVGALEIVSLPSEAEVTLNGNKVGFTPLKLKDLNTGEYTLNLTKGNFLVDTTLIINPDIINRYNFQLRKGFGTLQVITIPFGANVFIDGTEKGLSPLIIENIPTGNYNLKINKIGYTEVNKSIDVNLKKIRIVKENLKKRSLLEIKSNQDSVYIMLNNNDLGFTPVSVFIDSGIYQLTAFKNGYFSTQDSILILQNKNNSLNIDLIPFIKNINKDTILKPSFDEVGKKQTGTMVLLGWSIVLAYLLIMISLNA